LVVDETQGSRRQDASVPVFIVHQRQDILACFTPARTKLRDVAQDQRRLKTVLRLAQAAREDFRSVVGCRGGHGTCSNRKHDA